MSTDAEQLRVRSGSRLSGGNRFRVRDGGSRAAVELMGGSPKMCLEAASLALSNLLGLVVDPIGGTGGISVSEPECNGSGKCADLCGIGSFRNLSSDPV